LDDVLTNKLNKAFCTTLYQCHYKLIEQYFYRSQCLNEQYFRLSCRPDEYLTASWKMARNPSCSGLVLALLTVTYWLIVHATGYG